MLRILLVEDEKDAASALRELLQRRDYEVISASTAKEALEMLNQDKFDLAIIDLILPDMHGDELCAYIRHNTRLEALPIIISTGIGSEFQKTQSKNLGANEFLSKPYRLEDLLSAIERCLKKKEEKC